MANIFTDWNPAADGATSLLSRILLSGTGLSFSASSLAAQSGVVNLGTTTQPELRASISLYNGGLSLVDLGPGIVLSTGDSQPGTENTRNIYAYGFEAPSLDAAMTSEGRRAIDSPVVRERTEVFDISSLAGTFSVTDPTVTAVRVNLVFGSETYPDLVIGTLGGLAAVFVNGVNYALFPGEVTASAGGTTVPLSMRDENQDRTVDQPVFLLNDKVSPYPFEIDAVSRKLTVVAPVSVASNTLKIAVGDSIDEFDVSKDRGDIADSVLFVQGLQGARYMQSGLFEVLSGTVGTDSLRGTTRREFFETGAGNDRITASGGNDIISAGTGVDTVVMSGSRTDYTLNARAAVDMMTVTDKINGRDGTIDLEQVEVIQFADRKVAIDLALDGGAGQVALALGVLYPAGLRDPAVVGALLGLADAGAGVTGICQSLADSGVLAALAGSNQPSDIARMAVRNVLKVAEPDAALVATLAAYMDGRVASYTPAQFLGIVAGLEVNQLAVNLVGLQQTGLEFL